MTSRIIWKNKRRAGEAVRRMGPIGRAGGTCGWQGQVLLYDDLPVELKLEGGKTLYKERYWSEFEELCDLDDVEAIISDDGTQLYPAEPRAG